MRWTKWEIGMSLDKQGLSQRLFQLKDRMKQRCGGVKGTSGVMQKLGISSTMNVISFYGVMITLSVCVYIYGIL